MTKTKNKTNLFNLSFNVHNYSTIVAAIGLKNGVYKKYISISKTFANKECGKL